MDTLGEVPIIFAGDFNSFSPEDVALNTQQIGLAYGPITMLVDPGNSAYSPLASAEHTWTDVYRSLHPTDPGISFLTFASRIDFIFVNQLLDDFIKISTVGGTASAFSGSDHLSVDVFLDFFPVEPESSSTTTTSSQSSQSTTTSGTTTATTQSSQITAGFDVLVSFIPILVLSIITIFMRKTTFKPK